MINLTTVIIIINMIITADVNTDRPLLIQLMITIKTIMISMAKGIMITN